MPSLQEGSKSTALYVILGAGSLLAQGCYSSPLDLSQSPAPFRLRALHGDELSGRYEDEELGGQYFSMYCSYCHNARSLAERPFSNYQNVVAHMRVRAYLTGAEASKIEAYLRRWHDVPPPTTPLGPGPKRELFSQPISELREDKPTEENADAAIGPNGGPAPKPGGAENGLPPALP
jgi:hypothetical protein